jgi:hypothetical protein
LRPLIAALTLLVAACAASAPQPLARVRVAGPLVPVFAAAAIPPSPAVASPAVAVSGPPAPPLPGYLKVELHIHTARSGDSHTPPEQVVAFYAAHGFDAIVITDHNVVTLTPGRGRMLVLPGIELTHNPVDCIPRPERRKCLIHMNGLFVKTPVPAPLPVPRRTSRQRIDLYRRYALAIRRLGGLVQLNHPNFQWTANAEIIITLAKEGLHLMEIANQGMRESNPGDATHPSVEALWDQALAAGVKIYGTATDDAHHYADVASARLTHRDVYPGNLGWIMVHARRNARSLRAAIDRGDFYASTGVTLARLATTPTTLEVEAAGNGRYRIECITTGGVVAQTIIGTAASCARDPEGTVRARLTRLDGPSGQPAAQAWTQPVWK